MVFGVLQGVRDAVAAGADAAEPLVVPEDIGRAAAQLLLEEVSRGGVTDGTHQGLLLLMAALGPEEMNEVGRQRISAVGVWEAFLLCRTPGNHAYSAPAALLGWTD